MAKSVKELYFEKEFINNEFINIKEELKKTINSFLQDNSKEFYFTKELNKTYEKIKPFLEKRWVKMNDDYCFDKKVGGCWLGLCNDNFDYRAGNFNSGTELEVVLNKMREVYQNNNIDIPRENELKKLTNLSNTPFRLSSKRPEKRSCYILYKIGNKVQGYDLDSGYLKNHHYGNIHPLYRLYKKNSFSLNQKEIFILWIVKKLIPIDFSDEFYKTVLNFEFELNELEIVEVKGNLEILYKFSNLLDILKIKDTKRATLQKYDDKMFFDINRGSWEVFYHSNQDNFKNPVKIELSQPLMAKDPKDDIQAGIIGIDFGTKSTVVVRQTETEDILPIRIGEGNLSKAVNKHSYENPTIMKFVDFEKFLNDYNEKQFRPDTNFNDLPVSYIAYNDMKEATNAENFTSFLKELKQWAGDTNRKIQIQDLKNKNYIFKNFLDLNDEDINPIEIYAYYLGLYINNQFNGIYLDYILSFPVTYEKNVRSKILESFKKGLRKSLPNIGDKINNLKVVAGASEPAAYATVAIEELIFEVDDEIEEVCYAIFDFGGGTTDFNFGLFNSIDEGRYDYKITHFGANGDKFLGGENLLEMLAFEIFKFNQNILRKNNLSFTKPTEIKPFIGSEILLSNSKEAKMNMVTLTEILRKFLERESFEENIFTDDIKLDLVDNNNELKSNIILELPENPDEWLKELLKTRIKKGINTFFEAMREAFVNNSDEINLNTEKIHIFLAGNSSKSPLVKEIFDEKIKLLIEKSKKEYQLSFKIYPPLDNSDDFEKPNGKTGVAFGLIESRAGGRILVVNKNEKDGEIKFKFYLGINKRKKFKIIINKETPYNKWEKFIDAGANYFEVCYTSNATATTNKLSIKDNSIRKKRFDIDKINPNSNVYIRFISPTIFEYVVSDDTDIKNDKYSSEIVKIELKEG